MDERKRIEKILDAVDTRIEEEVGALLGTDFEVSSSRRELASKQEIFEGLKGKQICAQMDITGEITGAGCLLVSIKDAIRLGGTLIMLPASELDEVVGREEYSEELEDSYGEIANIIAGSFTKDFEEMYPKSCRFVRKKQEVLSPLKVETESDQPVPDMQYFMVASSMVLSGTVLGELIMLMPAAAFGLEGERADDVSTEPAPAEVQQNPDSQSLAAETPETPETSVAEESSEKTDTEAEEKKKKPFDVEKHRIRVDRLLDACREQIAVEVGGLLGVDVDLDGLENRTLSKEDFFVDTVTGKQVVSDMEIVGDREGLGYLSVSLKDAIHLGGVLIMLPPSELEAVVAEEDFGEDPKDAFGEVANIISGVYTAVFEEQYTEKLRIIRKELQPVVPAKVDIDSDEPIPDRSYYVSTMSLLVDGTALGQVHMLFPPEVLQLETLDGPVVEEAPVEQQPLSETQPTGKAVAPEGENNALSAEKQTSQSREKKIDLEKHKKKIDALLGSCQEKLEVEVGALLGCDVTLDNMENEVISKEKLFFEEVSGKQILAKIEVVGDREGNAYLFVDLKDAIRIGGTLIMLPTAEMEKAVADESFGEDTKDAYAEIANIITGVYTAVFEEEYTRKLRFIRQEVEIIQPMKVDVGSDEPFKDEEFYLCRMDLTIGNEQCGKVHFLLPLALMELSGLGENGDIEMAEPQDSQTMQTSADSSISSESRTGNGGGDGQGFDVLLVGDDLVEAQKIAEVLSKNGYVVKTLTFKDDLYGYLPGQFKAVYLVMKQVNEQAFGTAIKVSAACSIPLIAAGPGWTKSTVIKAWKYGIRDILLTPAEAADIEENIGNNLMQMAA